MNQKWEKKGKIITTLCIALLLTLALAFTIPGALVDAEANPSSTQNNDLRLYVVVSNLNFATIDLSVIDLVLFDGVRPFLVIDTTERNRINASPSDLVLAWDPAKGLPNDPASYLQYYTRLNDLIRNFANIFNTTTMPDIRIVLCNGSECKTFYVSENLEVQPPAPDPSTPDPDPNPPPTTPSIPIAIDITNITIVGTNQVKIEWNYSGPNEIKGFRITNSRNNSTGVPLHSNILPRTAPRHHTLTLPDGTYDLAVEVIDNNDQPIGATPVKTFLVDPLAPPTNLRGYATDYNEILWEWTNNSFSHNGFNLYDEAGHLLARIEPDRTFYRETGLEEGRLYQRYLRAYRNRDGLNPYREGARSITASARTDSRVGSGSSTERVRIADAIDDALDEYFESRDVLIILRSDIDRRSNFVINTSMNRIIAFPHNALSDYGTGHVRIYTDEVELRIPARWLRRGTSSGGVAVAIREAQGVAGAPVGRVRVSPVLEFDIVRYVLSSRSGSTINSFSSSEPVLMTFSFRSSQLSNPTSLKIFRQNGNTWEEVPSTVDLASGTITAEVTRFSRFALFEVPSGMWNNYGGMGQPHGSTPISPYPIYPQYNSPLQPTYFPAGYPPNYFAPSSSPVGYAPHFGYQNPYEAAAPFLDIIGHWARPQIEEMARRGIIRGTAYRTFEPDRIITRAEFITLLVNATGSVYSLPGTAPFSDVRSDDWYAGSVRIALQRGIITERSGSFHPNSPILRQDMAAWTGRTLQGRTTYSTGMSPESLRDWNQVSLHIRSDVARVLQAGIMQGRPGNVFDPHGNTTRAEAATIIFNFLERTR
ncbi:S-layer homology domain-containing protein [Heliorestis convoluta]|uniref:Amylopullulanase domain protein, putative n=1 Tax=Heliorestis convoluta TaxID=356322 RepID=A0A5Q2N1L2_9FIRM|nr:S-layer homology domain-containing protein [Heliorestis convoluta]QGG47182.1 Amylopullulanase domain protein, putative [Heliorestis convoluta]